MWRNRKTILATAFLLATAITILVAQTQSSPKPDPPRSITELLFGNVGAFLTGIAAIIASAASYVKARSDLAEFKRDFQNQLVQEDSIKLIRKQGEFVTAAELKSFGEQLRHNESVLIETSIFLDRLSLLIPTEDPALKKKMEEQAQKMLDAARKVF